MNRLLVRLAVGMTGNAGTQKLLERMIPRLQQLIGIGVGASTEMSGEKVLVTTLKERHRRAGGALCIFDVGANQGKFVELLESGLSGIPFHLHAFEPSRRTYELLCANAGRYGNVTLNNKGLGRQSGRMELHTNEEGSGLASVYKRRLDHYGIDLARSETVAIDTLDGYCREHDIRGIDLLKLDVEGHELEVLKGGAQLFSRRAVSLVSFEFGGCNIDSRTYFQDFYYFFKEQGMTSICRVAPSGRLTPIGRYDEVHEQFRTTNFVVFLEP